MSERLVNLSPYEPNELRDTGHSFTADADGSAALSVYAKWDGCIEISRQFNEDPEDVDTLHICDINHFIAFLEAVRDEGVRRYPDEWAMPEGKEDK